MPDLTLSEIASINDYIDRDVASVCVRMWFDRKNGNTYHSVAIYLKDDAGNVHTREPLIDAAYGGDRQYQTTIGCLVADANRHKGDAWSYRQHSRIGQFLEGHGRVTVDVCTVGRRADLHNARLRTMPEGSGTPWSATR